MLTLKAIIVRGPVAFRKQLDTLTGKMALQRHRAGLRTERVATATSSAKTSLRAIVQRWLALDEEIKAHDVKLSKDRTVYRSGLMTRKVSNTTFFSDLSLQHYLSHDVRIRSSLDRLVTAKLCSDLVKIRLLQDGDNFGLEGVMYFCALQS